MSRGRLICGDSIEALRELPDSSIGAVVTDPPYGLGDTSPRAVSECLRAWAAGESWTPKGRGFMGRAWDAWVPGPELWREVFRVLKPGGHALVFAGSRTSDLMAISLRLAGFELRDSLQWLYGVGFPKNAAIDKAIDRELGRTEDREVVALKKVTGGGRRAVKGTGTGHGIAEPGIEGREYLPTEIEITRAASEEAQRWVGWGSALKPAYEPILLCRKPIEGNLAQNTLKHGVGGIHIDGCRIPTDDPLSNHGRSVDSPIYSPLGSMPPGISPGQELGRWPANVILDERAGEMLDEQAPRTGAVSSVVEASGARSGYGWQETSARAQRKRDRLSGASRFFYCPKASVKEKEAGLEDRAQGVTDDGRQTPIDNPYQRGKTLRKNTHPTVKPLDLMKNCVRLITPEDQVVLDPFAGSGSTLIAAGLEGREYLGIELDPDHVRIAQARLDHWLGTQKKGPESGQMELF